MSKILDIEQHLQNNQVFTNGISGKPCHMDSYMTTLDFEKLKSSIEKSEFTKEDWLAAADYWENKVGYLGPIIKLTGKTVNRWIKEGYILFSNSSL
jgi:hypothetical protein